MFVRQEFLFPPPKHPRPPLTHNSLNCISCVNMVDNIVLGVSLSHIVFLFSFFLSFSPSPHFSISTESKTLKEKTLPLIIAISRVGWMSESWRFPNRLTLVKWSVPARLLSSRTKKKRKGLCHPAYFKLSRACCT